MTEEEKAAQSQTIENIRQAAEQLQKRAQAAFKAAQEAINSEKDEEKVERISDNHGLFWKMKDALYDPFPTFSSMMNNVRPESNQYILQALRNTIEDILATSETESEIAKKRAEGMRQLEVCKTAFPNSHDALETLRSANENDWMALQSLAEQAGQCFAAQLKNLRLRDAGFEIG